MTTYAKKIFWRWPPIAIVLSALLIAFATGFFMFSEKIAAMTIPPLNSPADGIIVLTGGKARIETAIELLERKRGKRLLISGVHPSTKREDLQRVTHAPVELIECCIDLDQTALNTAGNAEESIRWVRQHGYKRIIVVTNNYHMPRSILELSRMTDEVEFIPYPVINTNLKESGWLQQSDTLRVLFTEYVKYLGALTRLNRLPLPSL